jgi:hypothetical protein
MTDDPFFNQVSQQLIQTPAASLETLRAAMPERDPEAEAEPQAWSIETAFSWARDILKEKYAPSRKNPFMMFPKENGFCDVVRAMYRVGEEYDIEIAQSRYLICIKINGFLLEAKEDVQLVEAVAKEFIATDEPLKFLKTGEFAGGSCGQREVAPDDLADPEWPHWVDDLRWWRKGPQVAFLTIKAAGGPTRELIEPTEEMNLDWFD